MDLPTSSPHAVATRLNQLRTELIDLAFALERQRRLDAADIALQLEGRLRLWSEEILPLSPGPARPSLYDQIHDPELSPHRLA